MQIQDLFQTLSHEKEILTISRSGNSETEQRKKKMKKGKRDGRGRKNCTEEERKGKKGDGEEKNCTVNIIFNK